MNSPGHKCILSTVNMSHVRHSQSLVTQGYVRKLGLGPTKLRTDSLENSPGTVHWGR